MGQSGAGRGGLSAANLTTHHPAFPRPASPRPPTPDPPPWQLVLDLPPDWCSISLVEKLAAQYASSSYGDLLFSAILGLLLRAHVRPSTQRSVWRALAMVRAGQRGAGREGVGRTVVQCRTVQQQCAVQYGAVQCNNDVRCSIVVVHMMCGAV